MKSLGCFLFIIYSVYNFFQIKSKVNLLFSYKKKSHKLKSHYRECLLQIKMDPQLDAEIKSIFFHFKETTIPISLKFYLLKVLVKCQVPRLIHFKCTHTVLRDKSYRHFFRHCEHPCRINICRNIFKYILDRYNELLPDYFDYVHFPLVMTNYFTEAIPLASSHWILLDLHVQIFRYVYSWIEGSREEIMEKYPNYIRLLSTSWHYNKAAANMLSHTESFKKEDGLPHLTSESCSFSQQECK